MMISCQGAQADRLALGRAWAGNVDRVGRREGRRDQKLIGYAPFRGWHEQKRRRFVWTAR